MIVRLAGFVIRCLCEVAALLVLSGVLMIVLAVRLTRRMVTDQPGRIDKLLTLGIPPAVIGGILLWQKAQTASSAARAQTVESDPLP